MSNEDQNDARTVRPGQSVTYHPPLGDDEQLRLSAQKLSESIKHDQAIKAPMQAQPNIDRAAFNKMETRLISLRTELRARGAKIGDRDGLAKLVEYTNLRCQLSLAKSIEQVAEEFGTTPDFLVRLPNLLAMQADLKRAQVGLEKVQAAPEQKPGIEERVDKLEASVDEILRLVRETSSKT
jgi:hypothetical protein